jgi:hypothetical protein
MRTALNNVENISNVETIINEQIIERRGWKGMKGDEGDVRCQKKS